MWRFRPCVIQLRPWKKVVTAIATAASRVSLAPQESTRGPGFEHPCLLGELPLKSCTACWWRKSTQHLNLWVLRMFLAAGTLGLVFWFSSCFRLCFGLWFWGLDLVHAAGLCFNLLLVDLYNFLVQAVTI